MAAKLFILQAVVTVNFLPFLIGRKPSQLLIENRHVMDEKPTCQALPTLPGHNLAGPALNQSLNAFAVTILKKDRYGHTDTRFRTSREFGAFTLRAGLMELPKRSFL